MTDLKDIAAQFELYVAQCEAAQHGAASGPPLQRGSLNLIGRRWTWRWRDLPNEQGRRVRRSRVIGTLADFPTEAAARAEADRLRAYVMPPLVDPGKSPTFEHVTQLYERAGLPFVKRSSARQVRYAIANHFNPVLAQRRLHTITTPVIQAFVLLQVQRGVKRSTIVTRLGYLLRVLSWALGKGYAAVLPRRGEITLPRRRDVVQTPRDLAYTDAEFDAILNGAAFPYRALYALLGYTGLRVNEALALTWRHVDLEARTPIVRVCATVSAGEITSPKSKAAVREVPVRAALAAILREYRMGLGHASGLPLTGLVFPGRAPGRPRSDSGVLRDHLTPLLERMGVKRERMGFHAFRHRRAVELADDGAPLALLLKLMGWSNPEAAWPYLRSSTRSVTDFTEPRKPRAHVESGAEPDDEDHTRRARKRLRESGKGPTAARRAGTARAQENRNPSGDQSLARETGPE